MPETKKLLSVADVDRLTIDEVHRLYRDHVNSSKVDLLKMFGFGRDLADHSEGVWIHTKSGRKVLDFTGGIGVLNHGHNHPRILKVRREFQERRKMEVHKNYFSQYVAALSHNLAALLPGDLDYCFFPNSGSEAVDGAMKTAWKYHDLKRDMILYSDVAFHGKLFGAASVTHSPENHYPYPKVPNTAQFIYDDLASVQAMVDRHRKPNGECNIAGLILEPFNVSNMRPASEAFLRGVRQICDREDIVMIYDEVYSGWCKTGHLFNFMQYEGLLPDVLCMAKSFGGGKASISGLVTRAKIFKRAFDNPVSSNLQTSTFYGFGEETVTAIEAVNIMVEEDYVGKSRHIGQRLRAGLETLQGKHPGLITRFQGAGALYGIFFKEGPAILNALINKIPSELYQDPRFMKKLITLSIVSDLYDEHGIMSFTSLGLDIHLIVAPPLVITDEEIDIFLSSLDKTLSKGLITLVLNFAKKKFL